MEITLRPTYKQHLVNEALKDPTVDTVFFGGGAGGGKTWEICETRLTNALRYPGYKSYIGREELKRLMQSTYMTWVKVCAYHKIPQSLWKLNGQYNYIEFTNGSRIDLLDLNFLPTDRLYERFGSLEYTDGSIEEAGEVEFMAYDVLKTRVGRHMNKEFGLHPTTLITSNPKKNWTYQLFYKPWKNNTLAPNLRFIQSLYIDNEHTSEDYGKQLAQITDKSNRERLMYGNWEYEDDPATLIQFDAINDLWTNVITDGQMHIIADIARYGSDRIVIKVFNGFRLTQVHVRVKQGTDQTARDINDIATECGVPRSHILIDEDGIGGGVLDLLPGAKGFKGGSAPFEVKHDGISEKPNYQNLKAQCAYELAVNVNERKMAIRLEKCTGITEIEFKTLLIEDLEQIKAKDMDKDGKLKIVPKDEVKERIGRSPDFGDCWIMRMWFELAPKAKEVGAAITYIPPNLGYGRQQPSTSTPEMPLSTKESYTHYPNHRRK